MRWRDLIALIGETARGWFSRGPFTLGAALAYYGVFALAPTLVIAIAVAGILFGEDAAYGQLTATMQNALGPAVAQAIAEVLAHVHVTRTGWKATIVGFGLVFFAATGLFTQLQMSLNLIWGVQPKPNQGLWPMLRSRLFAFILVLALGALLLVSLIANTVLVAVNARLAPTTQTGMFIWSDGANWLLLLALLTLLFALIFKLLPDVIITWRDVAIGAVLTALLFELGNYLICLYLNHAAPASVYGQAGSLVVVMLWVYYSSQTLLFGAEFTKNFANKYGDPMRPANYAMNRPH